MTESVPSRYSLRSQLSVRADGVHNRVRRPTPGTQRTLHESEEVGLRMLARQEQVLGEWLLQLLSRVENMTHLRARVPCFDVVLRVPALQLRVPAHIALAVTSI